MIGAVTKAVEQIKNKLKSLAPLHFMVTRLVRKFSVLMEPEILSLYS